jgi:hypothetical protein
LLLSVVANSDNVFGDLDQHYHKQAQLLFSSTEVCCIYPQQVLVRAEVECCIAAGQVYQLGRVWCEDGRL